MDKGGYTPHEPFRSHQDWEGSLSLLLLNPSLHDDLHGCLAHLPRALISVPDWSRVGAWLPAARPLPTLLLDDHGGKGRSPLSPAPPIPAPGGARPVKKKVDRQATTLELRLATEHLSTALGRQNPRLPHHQTDQLPTPSSKSVAIITNPSLAQTCR